MREPFREDHTICTAVAPEAVFTVRTYATTAPYGPTISAQISDRPTPKTAGQRPIITPTARKVAQVSRPAPGGRTVVREDSAVVTCCARVRRGGIMMVFVVVVPGKTLVL